MSRPTFNAKERASMADDRDDELTPEEREADERRIQAARGLLAWVLSRGLKRSATQPNDFIHPDDPELSAWRDPHTEEMLLSPKLGALLVQEVKEKLNDQ